METIIANKTIILNKRTNRTFVANENDVKTIEFGEKYEWCGELDVRAYGHKYYDVAQKAVFLFCKPFTEITKEDHQQFIDFLAMYDE